LSITARSWGDVENMEGAALKDNSGSLSHLPQHVAEAGSDAYDQSLALDIADVDRKLIKEIDDALARILDGSYGLCQATGKPINKERLEELPWTRFSIEAAREHEKRTFFVPRNAPQTSEE
jgi:RNA polymerase-binding transcription factor DksA